MNQKEFPKNDQIYFCKFWSNRKVWHINLYVPCETSPMVWSKFLMNITIGVRNILNGWGRLPEGWTDLLLYIFELQRSVIYQFVCTLWDKSNGVIKITYGHHPWGKEYPPCIRKTISGTFLINFFLDIYISVVCQIVCIFKDKSNGDDDNDANDDDDDDEDNDEKNLKTIFNFFI